MIEFHKYHGAGNDFILLDDRDNSLREQFDQTKIALWCDRHFGIGADGLMFLRSHPDYDFEMIYYNSDGAPSSMCGNGGRCIVRFAADCGLGRESYSFLAVDGAHRACLLPDGGVSLEMSDVKSIEVRQEKQTYVLDTGSPHYISFVDDTKVIDVVNAGRIVRYNDEFTAKGINVNFVTQQADRLDIATYERGVENETLACGTGVTAAAIASVLRAGKRKGTFNVAVSAKGGDLRVKGELTDNGATALWLEGPAKFVFVGKMP